MSKNAVKKTERAQDPNIMGIVSSQPSIVGNTGLAKDSERSALGYQKVIVGLLGQVLAKVSDENGPIRPGDSLTSASRPGYLMRADAGD